jgi:predicted enzyme related to lactoylglutathione lyase
MATVSHYRNGVPNWVDVAVPDLAAATRFYTELFGWDAEDQGEDAGHYTMFSIDGQSVAGMGPRQGEGGGPPLWGTYLSVGDLDSALVAVEADGGTIAMGRMDVLDAGSMAVVVDPSGALVHLWQPGDHIGCERVNEPNTLVWNELATRDPGAVMPFYTAVVGWEFEPLDHDDPGGYQLIKSHGRIVGGLVPMVGEDWGDLGSHWMTYFGCADADALAARAGELGGAVSVEPFDMPVGRVAVLNDPGGNAFSVIALAGEPDDPNEGWAD